MRTYPVIYNHRELHSFSEVVSTVWTLFKMDLYMVFGWTTEELQVLGSVVKLIPVNVVNHFIRLQVSSQLLLHHKAMFRNVSIFMGKRMIGYLDLPISSLYRYSTTPVRIFIKFSPPSSIFRPLHFFNRIWSMFPSRPNLRESCSRFRRPTVARQRTESLCGYIRSRFPFTDERLLASSTNFLPFRNRNSNRVFGSLHLFNGTRSMALALHRRRTTFNVFTKRVSHTNYITMKRSIMSI